MVAEKPILAESIAKILSNGNCRTKKGWNGACSVSEYRGNFRGRSANFKVTSTCGHVMGVDFPARYNSWDKVNPSELFICPIEQKEANPKLKMPAFLASEAKNFDYLILWLDCDKEGENICFEVIDAVKHSMKQPNTSKFMDVVFRAHFSAITEKEIKKAMAELVKPNLNESLSVDARQELDLRIGCAFTRYQTRYFQDKYGDLDSNLISYGPCQTPTLSFCVCRHDEIIHFKPQPYWLLHVEISLAVGRTLKLEWTRDRQFERGTAQSFLNKIKKCEDAVVVEISQKEHKKEKPVALNTVELLRVASNSLGLSPAQTMSVAEHLYTRGYISYPRTETTAYPDSFDFISIVRELAKVVQFSTIANKIIAEGISRAKSGINKGDHPPITPMKAMDGWLTGDNAKIYEYISQHFLATLLPPCRYITKTVKFLVGDEEFIVHSRVVIDPGFTQILTWMAVAQEEMLDSIQTGQHFPIKECKLDERMTTAPDYLTEAELITLMEKYGIGTDASIPTHISNICNRNYVKVEAGSRKLCPTKLGIALIHGYQRVDPELIQPTMRADVEKQLDLIAKGKADYEQMKNHTLEVFRQKYSNFVLNINLVDALFEDSFKTLADAGKPFSKCGKCRRFMKLVESRPQRLFCPTCQETYSVPSAKDATIRLHFERICPIDGFELLYFHTTGGKLSKGFAFCPHCFNNPPFEDMKGRNLGCNECTHPECPNSFTTQGVLPCMNSCFNGKGVLVLDPQSGPKWRLSCNKCAAVVGVFEGASKLRVLDPCSKCGAKKLSVEYKNEKLSKLPDKALLFTGCAFCEQHSLDGCINLNHAFIDKATFGGGRPRGKRGRGGAGRGRGAGRNTEFSTKTNMPTGRNERGWNSGRSRGGNEIRGRGNGSTRVRR